MRERRSDIEALVEHFVAAFAAEDNLRKKHFSPQAMERLVQHSWQGNVRELRNTVERVLIMAPGDNIDVTDLPESIRFAEAQPAGQAEAATLKEFKETSERAFLGNEAARERLEHLSDRSGHRHSAK